MYKEDRLPQTAREGLIYLLVVSILSVNTIAPLIIFLERGFSWSVYVDTLKILPIMWVIAVILVKFVAGPVVGKIMPHFVGQTDGFNARVLLTILLNVTVLSICFSIVGTWVGEGAITAKPFTHFLHIWPRNFAIAFWIELLIAQPAARAVMKYVHRKKNRPVGVQA